MDFESEFLGMSRQGKVYDYFMRQVENLKATKHIGNAKVYERTLRMLAKYDPKIKERVFSELDIKSINRFKKKEYIFIQIVIDILPTMLPKPYAAHTVPLS